MYLEEPAVRSLLREASGAHSRRSRAQAATAWHLREVAIAAVFSAFHAGHRHGPCIRLSLAWLTT